LTALLLVIGQSLWKVASKAFLVFKGKSLFTVLFKLILSWQFILGGVFYVVATLLYVYLFSKFPYFAVQLTLVSFSIIFSLLVSTYVFKEGLGLINYIGAFIIILGVVLVTWKK
jgi:drug/metabolite transporter (DMT)-like permease